MPGTVNYSRYEQVQPLVIGTALTSSGTVVPAPAAGGRILMDYLEYWAVDPSVAGTVTVTLGTVVVPPVILSSSRSFFYVDALALPAATPISVTLGGSGSVGFFCKYLVATG